MLTILVNPPSPSPQPVMPLGLAFLAAALEQNGFEVQVIDAWAEGLGFRELDIRLRACSEVGLIGVPILSPGFDLARRTIETARQACPHARIITGGTHPSALPAETLEQIPALDFVCAGEGDELIVRLAAALREGSDSFSNMDGLGWRDGKRIRVNGRTKPVADLDLLPPPAVHLFPIRKYRMHPPYRILRSAMTMITSRGCPFDCLYCTKSVSGRNFRWQKPERILDEIAFFQSAHGIRQIHFYDDEFTMPRERTMELCRGILTRGIKLLWSCVTRVDQVDPDLLSLMKKAGCWLISYGVESGSQEILDRIEKRYSVQRIRDSFRITREAGIRTLGYFMAGFPGETRETLDQTIRFSFELDPDFVSWSILALYPGSRLYEQLRRTANDTSYPFFADEPSSISPFSHGKISLLPGITSREEIKRKIGQAYRAFYFRPGFLRKSLLRLQTLTEGLSYLQTFLQYIRWMNH